MKFTAMFRNRYQKVNSMVCVGLDGEYGQISDEVKRVLIRDGWADNISPESIIFGFNKALFSATKNFVCAYKLNAAFYEAELQALQRIIEYIRFRAPDIPIILDAKRADIGNSSKHYAKIAFDVLGVDAVTVNPYFGSDALEPFLLAENKGIFIVCKTSNPGSGEFQDRQVFVQNQNTPWLLGMGQHWPLWKYIAWRVSNYWNTLGNCGLVVGATFPGQLKEVREVAPGLLILSPGIGAQGGDPEGIVRNGLDSAGSGLIISVSRTVIYASGSEDFARRAGIEVRRLQKRINEIKEGVRKQ